MYELLPPDKRIVRITFSAPRRVAYLTADGGYTIDARKAAVFRSDFAESLKRMIELKEAGSSVALFRAKWIGETDTEWDDDCDLFAKDGEGASNA